MEKEDLKNYLKCAYELEASIFNQKRVYNAVYREYQAALSSYHVTKELPYKQAEEPDCGFILIGGIIIGILVFFIVGANIINISFGILSGILKIAAVIIFAAVVGSLVGGLVGFLIEKLVETIQMKGVIRQVELENMEIDRHNEKIRVVNSTAKALARRKAAAVEVRLNEIKSNINQTKALLDQVYSYDIIFTKYRKLVAVSSFYEYFVSGRCEQLEGHYGAYNKYEDELRHNLIIDKLEEVIVNLKDIKETLEENQLMLYRAIQEGNSSLQKIERGIQGMSASIQKIENNEEITAYNSRISASNSEITKNLQLMDMIFRK